MIFELMFRKGNRKTSTTADLYGSMGGESASLHDNKDVTERVILKVIGIKYMYKIYILT